MSDEGVLKLVLNTARLDESLPIISERLSLQGLPWYDPLPCLLVPSMDPASLRAGG